MIKILNYQQFIIDLKDIICVGPFNNAEVNYEIFNLYY